MTSPLTLTSVAVNSVGPVTWTVPEGVIVIDGAASSDVLQPASDAPKSKAAAMKIERIKFPPS
jgi:hypothetical protein